MWDVATGRKRRGLTGHPDPEAVTFGPDGRTVAAVGLSGLVRVWDVATGRTRSVRGGRIDGRAVAFSPDGRTYAVRVDGSVQLREAATGVVRHTFKDVPVGGNEVAFAPDGRTIAIPSDDDTVRLWDTASGTARTTVTAGHHRRGVMKVALSADGRTLVTSSNGDPDVRVHRLPVDLPQTSLPGSADTSIDDIVFSPDGHAVATVRQGPPGTGAVQLWDAGTGDREASLPLDTDSAPGGKQPSVPVRLLAAVGIDPTGRALAARSVKKGVIEVRDVATGRLRLSRALGADGRAVFSPDGTRLAVVGWQGAVHLLDLSTGTRPTTVKPENGSLVRKVAFTPDGRTLAAVDIEADGDQVRLLDAATGRSQRTIKLNTQFLSSIAFGPDGGTLATVSGSRGSVTTWDVRTGRLQDSFRVEGEVASLAFSPDARTLAASGPRGVQLWDLATGQTRLTLPTRSPEAVAFSPDGRTLAVGTDGSVDLWSVNLPDPARAIRDICAAVDTDLTPLEQSRYLHDQSAGSGCRRAAP
jgi:WD40 repeat protein